MIIVVEDGIISDMGSHQGLMEKSSGLYRHLYTLQSLQAVES
jgi:ABC-type multidrug transport system fused ATPase/permease subunit